MKIPRRALSLAGLLWSCYSWCRWESIQLTGLPPGFSQWHWPCLHFSCSCTTTVTSQHIWPQAHLDSQSRILKMFSIMTTGKGCGLSHLKYILSNQVNKWSMNEVSWWVKHWAQAEFFLTVTKIFLLINRKNWFISGSTPTHPFTKVSLLLRSLAQQSILSTRNTLRTGNWWTQWKLWKIQWLRSWKSPRPSCMAILLS